MKHPLNETNPANLTSTVLPNNYGKIRTLKDDLANLKSAKKESPMEPLSQPTMPAHSDEIQPAGRPQFEVQSPVPEKMVPLPNSNPAKKEESAETAARSEKKSDMPNPFGSDTFFQTRSPCDEKAGVPKKESAKSPAKSSSKLGIILSSLLILVILGGGACYWWFFMRSAATDSPLAAPTAPATTSQSEKTSASATNTAQNNLKQWALDLEADKIANKLAIERYAKSLAGSVSQGKATEVKLVSKDDQPVTPQVFSGFFDFVFPASVSEKLTGDYSLFVSNENGDPRLGAAFKLAQSENLAESLKSEEGDLFSILNSFYLDRLPADTQINFNSSKYLNADIRYYNFPSPANTSLDYTVLSSKENSYFIFSTSKDSIRAILDYMSEK